MAVDIGVARHRHATGRRDLRTDVSRTGGRDPATGARAQKVGVQAIPVSRAGGDGARAVPARSDGIARRVDGVVIADVVVELHRASKGIAAIGGRDVVDVDPRMNSGSPGAESRTFVFERWSTKEKSWRESF